MAHDVPEVEPGDPRGLVADPVGPGPGRSSLDPRVERTRELALGAAVELFREGGWDAVTHLAVSERSGVGRTTLYRHWPDTHALLREVVVVRSGADQLISTGEIRADLVTALERLRENLLDPAGERAMLTVMERAAVDPSYAELRSELTRACSRHLISIVQEASADGRLRSEVDPEAALAELAGPLVFRRFFCRDDLTRPFVEQVVDDFLTAHRGAEMVFRR